ncbi:type II secretion system GspH family protein [Ectobacillus sp. JY-23]|uniref:competence type IV pilus minor pilin ComGD n=1 Tax=Ectobacillus sp. JY-23 TaxID=2933872 RepID=UPI001FF2C90B|nr:competence type IV pilus minor pilin ComGD [Ectobacillus sp. JY-23]UOY93993.1 type II secretion system GspH family protein [Ectobacillus sp. JY-23]
MIRSKISKMRQGFTFLETLLVLSIVSILLIVSFGLYPKYEARVLEHFLEQLQKDIMFMQQTAMSHNIRHRLHWFPSDSRYVITGEGTVAVLVRNYDTDIQVRFETLSLPLIYSANGNISRGGTMYVSYKKSIYKVVFQLGKGRFYYSPI